MTVALINHLWQSTLFVIVAAVLALALRRNRAQVRFWAWFAASLKFLVPFALLVNLGSRLESVPAAQKIATPIATPVVSYSVEQFTQPFSEVLPRRFPAQQIGTASASDWLPAILIVLWLAGFVTIAFMRGRAWLQLRAAIQSSSSVEIAPNIEARMSPHFVEPGVVGVLRPVLLLPDGLLSRLTPDQLRAVVAHELCHVQRRDNLTSGLHMVVEAIFWFHPLVWWVGTRLVAERERACDEKVLQLGTEPTVYAEGILNVCKHYQESPLLCVPGVTGSDLKTRIELIMRNHAVLKLSLGKVFLLCAISVLAMAAPIAAGVIHASASRLLAPPAISAAVRVIVPAEAAPPAAPLPLEAAPRVPQPAPQAQDRFEVVSVRPADPTQSRGGGGGARGDGGGGGRGGAPGTPAPCAGGGPLNPGRFSLKNATVYRLITLAYGKNCRASSEIGLIRGLPEWVATQAFDIDATLPAGSPRYTFQELQNGEAPRLQAMLQNLLADRFRLVLHRDSKDAPLYNLVFVKDGRIKLSDDQTPPPPPVAPTGPPAGPPTGPFVMPRGGFRLNVDPPAGIVHMEAKSIPLSTLINVFQGQEGRLVIDKTGMKGLYDIPDVSLDVGPFDISPNAVSVWPEIMRQLGLRLDPARGPLEVLVIDRLDKPSEN